MDYVIWCHNVLDVINSMAKKDDSVRFGGFTIENVYTELFDGPSDPFREKALQSAIVTLRDESMINPSQTFDKARFRWLVNSNTEKGPEGMEAVWWRHHTQKLDNDAIRLIEIVNDLSEIQADDCAYLQVVSREDVYEQFGGDGGPDHDPIFLAYAPVHRDLEVFGGQFAPYILNHNAHGDGMSHGIRSTYRSIALQRHTDKVKTSILNHIAASAPKIPDPQPIDVAFIEDIDFRNQILSDYREARITCDVGAFKSSTIMSASVIEGIFYSVIFQLQNSHPGVQKALRSLAKRSPHSGTIQWRKVSLLGFVNVAREADIIDESTKGFLAVTTDTRDTVHPLAQQDARNNGIPSADRELAEHMISAIHLLLTRLTRVLPRS